MKSKEKKQKAIVERGNINQLLMQQSKTNGITLIALVVTIVVLLILSGITISMVFSENGLIQKAQEAKDVQLIATYKDRISIVCLNWSLNKSLNDEIGVDNLWERMKTAEIILDIERDVQKLDDEGNYVITVPEGYKFQIHINENGDTEVEYIGKDNALLPYIQSIEVISQTTSSVNVEVTVTREGENLTLSYYYKKLNEPEENYIAIKENVEDKTVEVTGLESETIYNLKVVAKNENGESQKTVELTVEGIIGADEGLTEGAIIASEPTWDSNSHTASITLSKGSSVASNLSIQWQINSIDAGGWTTGTSVTGLNHNDTVYARLTDGVNYGQEASVTIKDGTAPTVTITKGTVTTKSIAVTASAQDNQWGMPTSPTYNYYIKESAAGSYPTSPNYTGTNTSYIFDNLSQTTSYDIKVTTTDKAGNEGSKELKGTSTGTVGGATGGLVEGNIIASSPTWDNNSHTASITLSKGSGVASNLSIQWQKNSINGTWTTGTSVTGLNHNDTVYARLTDGRNAGNEASVTIKDGTAPTAATITLSSTSVNTGTTVTATVTHKDNQSGPNITACRYIWNTSSAKLGTTASKYTGGEFSSNGEKISRSMTTKGTYYLHVLTVDKGGNALETVSSAITVKQLATGVTVSPTSASIVEGGTRQLTATVSPSTANNRNVTWSSNNTNVATVSSSGLVTAKAVGSATITVKTADGSNKTATCKITVTADPSKVENKLKEGDWVNYVDKNGTTRKCVVLYGPENANYASYGIQIITDDTVEDVTLGSGDTTVSGSDNFTKAMNSYNNAISTLNTRATAYLNTTYASDARCVGSVPNNKNSQSGYHTTQFTSSYSGRLRDEDNNYKTDYDKMEELGIRASNNSYWLASRHVSSSSSNSGFGVRNVLSDGILDSNDYLCNVSSNGSTSSISYASGLRPCFTLKSGIKVTGGSGTESSPYTLGV